MVAGFDGGEELFDERDFAEVIVPHGSVAFASVSGVAVAVGLLAKLVERGLDVGGAKPFLATTGVSERGNGLDVSDPRATAIVAPEEPIVLAVMRDEAMERHFADEFGIGGETAEGVGKVGGFVGVDGDELRGAFAGIVNTSFGIEWSVGDFLIEIAAELASVQSVTIRLHRSEGFGGAGKEEVGVGHGDALGGVSGGDLAKDGLETDWESGGGFGIAFAEPFKAAAGFVVDVVGHVVPEAFGAVLVKTADFDALFGGDVSDRSGAAAAELENLGEADGLAVESGLVSGVEPSV